MYDKAFLTGCDKNNEWMLDWWLSNYRKHNSENIPVIFANFGVTPEAREKVAEQFDVVLDFESRKDKNWFQKPSAMIEATKHSQKVCWIDTDCEILRPIGRIFGYATPKKLGMVQDMPWSKRRGSVWHNSGVVLIDGVPDILTQWKKQIDAEPVIGDQEVLHMMLQDDPLKRRVFIEDLPNIYNWLRIQLLDGEDSGKKKIIHWTGFKGKQHIRKLIADG